MNTTLVEKLNKQLNNEIYSAYKYFAMATYFKQITLDGFAKYMMTQAKEELGHAQKFYEYLIMRNQKITPERIEASDINWINTLNVFEDALSHEKYVTTAITHLYEYAQSVNDHSTVIFLQDFIQEQVEEESTFQNMLDKLQSMQSCDCAIPQFDRYLSKHGGCGCGHSGCDCGK